MPDPSDYLLRVTAGPSYDPATHVPVPVNSPSTIPIAHPEMAIDLAVRIQNYRGLPPSAPATSPYFDAEPHKSNGDLYSIAFRFTPKPPAGAQGGAGEGISGDDLQFGNDFDQPIRAHLPPGFNTALNIVRWWIDPGLDGDAYADKPYLYGPALSSFNAVRAGEGEVDAEKGGLYGAPEGGRERMRWALKEGSKRGWVWEYGRGYGVDFYNPYVDFDKFALRLPGFGLGILRYWDGQGLRYVLRNKSTGTVYLVVLFTLYRKEDVNEDGSLKPGAVQASGSESKSERSGSHDDEHEHFDEEKAIEEAKRKLSTVDVTEGGVETNADDVD
ncbi:hypothetical protein B0T18DRAFT_479631 [Schizothecium vesticola]|uniref:Domain of unknown function at the cortex 1 domain-containing protein n=1 Tax=Schizothecium vesticola TaxID=314040 RepID=A0AA40F2K0_9PEZI|nr:hypothetical protein B0T18DRAFT_479631 [Schizothecium vesticola]